MTQSLTKTIYKIKDKSHLHKQKYQNVKTHIILQSIVYKILKKNIFLNPD